MTVNGPDLDLVARVEGHHRVVVELVLLDLVAEQAPGEGGRIDRHARELGQDVRQAADVVLVGVGDEEGAELGAVLLEIGDVGDDEVDAEHLLVREHEPTVDDDDVVAVLEEVHVLADLAHPAERDDAERAGFVSHGFGCPLRVWSEDRGLRAERVGIGRGRRRVVVVVEDTVRSAASAGGVGGRTVPGAASAGAGPGSGVACAVRRSRAVTRAPGTRAMSSMSVRRSEP